MKLPIPADKHPVTMNCTGCSWIHEETERYRALAADFRKQGSEDLARLAEGGIESLAEDRRRHMLRDRAASDSQSLSALVEAVMTETRAAVLVGSSR
jgi:hypothetical protein